MGNAKDINTSDPPLKSQFGKIESGPNSIELLLDLGQSISKLTQPLGSTSVLNVYQSQSHVPNQASIGWAMHQPIPKKRRVIKKPLKMDCSPFIQTGVEVVLGVNDSRDTFIINPTLDPSVLGKRLRIEEDEEGSVVASHKKSSCLVNESMLVSNPIIVEGMTTFKRPREGDSLQQSN